MLTGSDKPLEVWGKNCCRLRSTPTAGTFNALLRLMRRPDIFLRGMTYLLMLRLYRVRMLSDYRVTDVIGDEKVAGVIMRRFREISRLPRNAWKLTW
ncbi:hypothetical protein T190_12240 [Sinorhizobium meliloti CCBAU 01290]|nr:hypothetical protein T190_12240 [Sinorhizobium meliloti CCBAU 01290]